jgi:hypothetical protein
VFFGGVSRIKLHQNMSSDMRIKSQSMKVQTWYPYEEFFMLGTGDKYKNCVYGETYFKGLEVY